MSEPIVIEAGQKWTPTRDGSRAKPRTVVWAGPKNPAVRWVSYPTVGFVMDPTRPGFPETGHDSWMGFDSFRAWIRKHKAVPSSVAAIGHSTTEVP